MVLVARFLSLIGLQGFVDLLALVLGTFSLVV